MQPSGSEPNLWGLGTLVLANDPPAEPRGSCDTALEPVQQTPWPGTPTEQVLCCSLVQSPMIAQAKTR